MAFENNVQATLQANVAIGATTVDVVKAVAPNKDVPVSGRLTLSATGKIEIISYTGRTDNTTYWTLTGVTKNAESSFGDQAWSAGDACFQALTAADVASLQGATGPAGVGGVKDFVASGTLPNGSPVILKSDGTVEAVTIAGTAQSIPNGTPSDTGLGNTTITAIAYDPHTQNRVVLAYARSGLRLVIGTISGTTITFGTEVLAAGGSVGGPFEIDFDPVTPNSFIVSYRPPSTYYGTMIAGTVSGTAITLGTATIYASTATNYRSWAFDPNTSGSFVVSASSSTGLKVYAGTLSGTTLTFGTPVTAKLGDDFREHGLSFDSSIAGNYVLSFKDNSTYPNVNFRIVAGTVSGTTATAGAVTTIQSVGTGSTFDGNYIFSDAAVAGKFIMAYRYGGTYARVCTVSGNTFAFGTAAQIGSGTPAAGTVSSSYNSSLSKLITASYVSSNFEIAVSTVSGTTVTPATPIVIAAGNHADLNSAFDPFNSGQFMMFYRNRTVSPNAGYTLFGQLALAAAPNLTADNFIGMSTAAYADGATSSIVLAGGVSANQTSLTTNSVYYVQTDGTISTTAGNPSVEAGRALSSTELLLTSEAGATGATGATGPAGAAGAQGEFSFIGTLFTYSITAGSLVGSSGTVDIVDGDVFRLEGYNGNNNSFGDGLYVATNNFSVTKSQTQSVVNTALQNNFPSNFEVFTLDGADGAEGEFNFIGVLLNYSIGTGLGVGSGTLDVVDGDVFRLDGYTGVNNSFADGLFVATSNFTLTKSGTSSGVNTSLQSNFPSNFEVFTLDGATGADGVGGVRDFVATGTLPNGQAVELMADGTVRAVAAAVTAESIPAGLGYNFGTSSLAKNIEVAMDPNNVNQFILLQGTQGYYTLGTINGTVITFSTSVSFNSENTTFRDISFASNGTFAISYRKNNGYAAIRIGTLIGSTITLGTEVILSSVTSGLSKVAFDPADNTKLITTYSVSRRSYCKVGTVSGTGVTFGTGFQYSSATDVYDTTLKGLSSGKFILAWGEYSPARGKACVATVSGTSISYGTPVDFHTAGGVEYLSLSVDPFTSTKFIVAFKGHIVSGNDYNGAAIVGTVSGTSITLGTANSFYVKDNWGAKNVAISFSPHSSGKFVVLYSKDVQNDSAVRTGSVTGTTISYGTETILSSAVDHNAIALAFIPDTSGKFVYMSKFTNPGKAYIGQMQAIGASTLNSLSYVGLSSAAYTDGQTASIILKGGVSTNQSGLTAGSRYYIQGDGTLGTSEATPSVEAGLAINATTLLLSGPAGEDGATGAAGSQGIQGIQGIQGATGPAGTPAATPLRSEFIATANQATKTGLTYSVGSIDCYINGAKMLLGTDFTATNGTSVTFTPALDLDDEVQLIMGVSASSAPITATGSTLPSSVPAVGTMFFKTDTSVLYISYGGAWVSV